MRFPPPAEARLVSRIAPNATAPAVAPRRASSAPARAVFAGIRLRDEAAKTLGEHRTDFALLGKPAAEYDIDVRIQRAQLIEHCIAIHDWQEEIENDEPDVPADLLINAERFETILCQHHLVPFVGEHFGGKFGNLRLVIHKQDQLAVAARVENRDIGWNRRQRAGFDAL